MSVICSAPLQLPTPAALQMPSTALLSPSPLLPRAPAPPPSRLVSQQSLSTVPCSRGHPKAACAATPVAEKRWVPAVPLHTVGWQAGLRTACPPCSAREEAGFASPWPAALATPSFPLCTRALELGTSAKLSEQLKAPGEAGHAGCSVSTAAPGCSLDIAALDSSLLSESSGVSSRESEQDAVSSIQGLGHDLAIGAHSRTGVKLNIPGWQNQDASLVLPLGRSRALVAVFDGHGQWGHLVAACIREVFSKHAPCLVPQAPVPLSDEAAGAALKRLFALAEEALAREVDASGRPLAEFSGSTATAALVDAEAGRTAVAHVGDSALMLLAGRTIYFRTVDHTVDEEAERRILAAGGEVQTFTVSGITARRVCMRGSQFPGLAMARALGDLVAHQLGVSSEPEVRTGVPFPPGAQLVLASDGVWETMPAEQAAHRVASAGEPRAAAWGLVEAARAQWPQEGNIDDITAVVVSSKQSGTRRPWA